MIDVASFISERHVPEVFTTPVSPEGDTQARFDGVRAELTERFGGVTFYRNAPAEGLWKDDGKVERDVIVVAEVMLETIDDIWWRSCWT
ncbi:hypothetical protein [Pararhizobium sp. PWRC1-1]|uniref:hypothetical protein n=1 Tax=Pararhizobium sp. PWRC1-1 TaxID=2804566 RepID=UPI003CF15D5D